MLKPSEGGIGVGRPPGNVARSRNPTRRAGCDQGP
jgi:hypothetical protein